MSSKRRQRINDKLRKQSQLTPWHDVWERDRVGATLVQAGLTLLQQQPSSDMDEYCISDALADLKDALLTVRVWQSRVSRLPHSVASTAAICETIHQQQASMTTNTSSSTSLLVRHAYSSTVIRAVNGLADVLQQHRNIAASVSMLGQQLGIPTWLVDVRHEATHNALPSLAVLRLACRSLLEYFRHMYWNPLAQQRQEAEQQAAALLQAYERATVMPADATGQQPLTSPIIDNADNAGSISDDDTPDDDKDNDVDEPNNWSQILGTSFNRFSVLRTPSKKRKQQANQTHEKDKPSTPSKKKKKTKPNKEPATATSQQQSLTSCARDYVRANIPFDILRHTLLSNLIWKENGGVLHAPVEEESSTEAGTSLFAAVQARYEPLLRAACNAWEGFSVALIVHLVDALLVVVSSPSSSADRIELLEAWIRRLLSMAAESNTRLPLNSLCDRCIANPATQRLAAHFQSRLKDKRVDDHGIVWSGAAVDNRGDDQTTKPPALMTLQEMDTLLDASTSSVAIAPSTSLEEDENATSRSAVQSCPEPRESDTVQPAQHPKSIDIPSPNRESSQKQGKPSTGRTVVLSLDDMETLLNCPPKSLPTEEASTTAKPKYIDQNKCSAGDSSSKQTAEGSAPPSDDRGADERQTNSKRDDQTAPAPMSLGEMESMMTNHPTNGEMETTVLTTKSGKATPSTSMTLQQMEEFLADGPQEASTPANNGCSDIDTPSEKDSAGFNTTINPTVRRGWGRCTGWDPCSIGTLPGFPL